MFPNIQTSRANHQILKSCKKKSNIPSLSPFLGHFGPIPNRKLPHNIQRDILNHTTTSSLYSPHNITISSAHHDHRYTTTLAPYIHTHLTPKSECPRYQKPPCTGDKRQSTPPHTTPHHPTRCIARPLVIITYTALAEYYTERSIRQ